MQAFILAAGLGTRLQPLTLTRPKALVEVAGRPLIWYALQSVIRAGARRAVVNVHHFGEQIIRYIERTPFEIPVLISDERQALLDTGGGLQHALSLLGTDEEVLVHNVDIFSTMQPDALRAAAPEAAAVLLVSERTTSRYLYFTASSHLCGWTHTATGALRGQAGPKRYAFSGIHLLRPDALRALQAYTPQGATHGKPAPFSIIDFYLHTCPQLPYAAHLQPTLQLLDVGKTAALSQAALFAQTLHPAPSETVL